jgi:hypothetical protein
MRTSGAPSFSTNTFVTLSSLCSNSLHLACVSLTESSVLDRSHLSLACLSRCVVGRVPCCAFLKMLQFGPRHACDHHSTSQARAFCAKSLAQTRINREKATGLFWRTMVFLPFFQLKTTLQQLGLFLCFLINSMSPCPNESGPANKLPLMHVVDRDTVILAFSALFGSFLAAIGPARSKIVICGSSLAGPDSCVHWVSNVCLSTHSSSRWVLLKPTVSSSEISAWIDATASPAGFSTALDEGRLQTETLFSSSLSDSSEQDACEQKVRTSHRRNPRSF